MIHLRSRLTVADNTGAREIAVFSMSGKNSQRHVRLGDIVVASVKEATPTGSVKKGDKVYAVIVRTRKEQRRSDGSYIRFDENAAVLIKKDRKSSIPRRFSRLTSPWFARAAVKRPELDLNKMTKARKSESVRSAARRLNKHDEITRTLQ